ncbi:MAG: hypothetical protein K6F32_06585 [Bacilli bacterium]|nr:hypothetical protein [Bacilli bacterium]
MEEIKLNPDSVYHDAMAFGYFINVAREHLHADENVIIALSAVYLLEPTIQKDLFDQCVFGFVEILKRRSIKNSLQNDVVFPEWDPEDHYLAEYHKADDVFFLLEAVNLSGGVDFEKWLGPLFTLSGAGLEGIAYGAEPSSDPVWADMKRSVESILLKGDSDAFCGNSENLIRYLRMVFDSDLA